MNNSLRLYCAQINATVGDFTGNFEKIASHIENAKKNRVDIIAFPELAITGYPPEDLVLKPAFIEKSVHYLSRIKDISDNITVIAGYVSRDLEIYNSAAILAGRRIISVYNKQFLPNYSVFDEERYFQQGSFTPVFELNGIRFGVNICEDIYYSSGPLLQQAIAGGAILGINISASPYHTGKIAEREKMLFTRAIDNRINILYVNLVGGQDELVFDGSSCLINEKGAIIYRAESFEEDFFIYDLDTDDISFTRMQDTKFKNQRELMRQHMDKLQVIKIPSEKSNLKNLSGKEKINEKFTEKKDLYSGTISCIEEEIFMALVLGTKDFILKNGFKKVVLGLSGGIDSALTAVIAAHAIGAKNVNAVLMPSAFSSEGSIKDSLILAEKTGILHRIISIKDIYSAFTANLESNLTGSEINVTKENIQARIRGAVLMALSNEYGWLVLATGNKSEISVGYCTLYGDMVGGFSPIKDVYKTRVYDICRFLNKKYNNIIPEQILLKAPSAELKPEQKDQDKLPPYETLDAILKSYIEDEKDYQEIVSEGFDSATVLEVLNMVDSNEYKRRQGSPGIKITARAFGRDRRYPITNKFRISPGD
jgi:NAD+ synthase (glutamine-hydrolysing)